MLAHDSGHVSIGVPDVGTMIAKLQSMGFEVTRPITVLIPGGPQVAFVQDQDGHEVELIQTARTPGPPSEGEQAR